jgi:16S rRNA processing protein RimM
MSDEKNIIVGRIGAPHGVRGQLRVQSFTADPLALGDYGTLVTGDGQSLDVTDIRAQKTMVVVSFAQVHSREAAEALNGAELHVTRSQLPDDALEDDEFYVQDLIGMDVRDEKGSHIGTVSAVENFGAGDLIEVAWLTHSDANGASSDYFPFTREVVPDVDLESRAITLVRPGAVIVAPEGSPERAADPDLSADDGA